MEDLLGQAVVSAFLQNHGYAPFEWQIESTKRIGHIAATTVSVGQERAVPILLCRPTGGSKSSVRDAAGLLIGGVVLTIVPLLSLAANQTQKILELQKKNPRISVFNLDNNTDSATNQVIPCHLEGLNAF